LEIDTPADTGSYKKLGKISESPIDHLSAWQVKGCKASIAGARRRVDQHFREVLEMLSDGAPNHGVVNSVEAREWHCQPWK